MSHNILTVIGLQILANIFMTLPRVIACKSQYYLIAK